MPPISSVPLHLATARQAQRVPPVMAGVPATVMAAAGSTLARQISPPARRCRGRAKPTTAPTKRGRQCIAAVLLSFVASGQLRDQMLGELNAIGSEDEAAKWAHRRLPDKNKLNGDRRQTYRGDLPRQALRPSPSITPKGYRLRSMVRKLRLQPSRSSRLRKPTRRNQNENPAASRSTNRFSLIPSRGASAIATMCALWRSRLV